MAAPPTMTTKSFGVPPGSLELLLPSWELGLRAARKSPKTIRAYGEAAKQLLDYLRGAGMPTEVGGIHREHVEAFIANLLDIRSPSTAATRFRGLQQLF